MMRSLLLLLFVPTVAACSGFLDLGGNGSSSDDKQPEGATPSTPGGESAPSKPKADCSGVPEGEIEIYRSKGSEAFNVMDLQSDGKHVYLAGSVSQATTDTPVPDPANPMKTASVIRVPVAGGEREVIEFEHGFVSRGVVLDDENIYWASEYQDAVLMRPKSGGPVTPFVLGSNGLGGAAGIPQSVATDGKGNVFWTTWHGSFASPSNPIAALGKRAAGSTAASTFQESHGEEDGAYWVTADATHVYWLAGRNTLELRAAPVAGGTHTVLAGGIEQGYRIRTDEEFVWGISNDFVWKVPKKGGERVNVASPSTGRDFRSLAVTDDAIFFSDDMEPTQSGKIIEGPIYRAKKDGSDVEPFTGDRNGASHLATDACRLYWTHHEWVGNPGYELVVASKKL